MQEIRKIGLVCAHSFFKDGGVQRVVIALYWAYVALGYMVKIIAPGPGKPHGVPVGDVINVGVSVVIDINGSKGHSNVSLKPRRVHRILKEEKFSVLHFHNMDLGMLSGQFLRASHSLNILTFHGSLDGSWLRLIRRLPFLLKAVYWLLYRRPMDGAIAVSEAAMATVRLFPGLESKIIPNGVDVLKFHPGVQPLDRPEFQDGKKNILFVGRFEKRKGLIYLLKAFRELRKNRDDIRLIIVGKSSWYSRTKAKLFMWRNRLSKDVWFEGRVSDDLLPNYYATADIFCAPSVSGESFGLILLEAMRCCHAAVVAFDNLGYGGLLRQDMREDDGIVLADSLVRPRDWRGLAAKIGQFLDDPEQPRELVERGFNFSSQFLWAPIAKGTMDFCKELWAKKEGL